MFFTIVFLAFCVVIIRAARKESLCAEARRDLQQLHLKLSNHTTLPAKSSLKRQTILNKIDRLYNAIPYINLWAIILLHIFKSSSYKTKQEDVIDDIVLQKVYDESLHIVIGYLQQRHFILKYIMPFVFTNYSEWFKETFSFVSSPPATFLFQPQYN